MPDITLQLGKGALQSESLLIDAVSAARRAALSRDGAVGAAPVVIVVPSRSLRVHVIRRLAALKRSEFAVGVQCLTVYGLARQLGDLPPVELPETLEWMCERFARRHSDLSFLGDFQDGFGPVAAPVRDLLDAGFRAELADVLIEVLSEPELSGVTPRARERVRALIEVAARTDAAIEELQLPSRPRIYRLATAALVAGGCRPFSAVIVHGFAEVTGVVGDFLEALLRAWGGHVIVDTPPDPLRFETSAEADVFTRRLRERIEIIGDVRTVPASGAISDPNLRLAEAPDPRSEVDVVAQRVRDLIDEGAPPEDIAVVVRDPGPYRAALRDRFERLAIPFSVTGIQGSPLPTHRRLTTMLDLLDQRSAFPVERWLEIQTLTDSHSTSAEIALAFASRGLARLSDVGAIDEAMLAAEPEFIPLPLPRLRSAEEGAPEDGIDELDVNGDERPNAAEEHPGVSRASMQALTRLVRGLLDALREWEGRERLGSHRETFEQLLFEHLAWPRDGAESVELRRHVLRPLANLPAELPIGLDEFRRLVSRLSATYGRAVVGGAGGGVQLLDVISGRGRSFSHLFLLGLNRGNFPRTVREDALLPDAIRDALAVSGHGTLPDLPRKKSGFDEENYLFAQLVSASEFVHLSWSRADADGEPLVLSPWVDRLRSAFRLEPEPAPPLWADPGGFLGEPAVRDRRLGRRPADEWARLAGLHADRAHFARLLPHALAQTQRLSPPEAAAMAASRRAVLDEFDPDLATREGRAVWARLGPFSGLPMATGETSSEGASHWVTALEAYARCPWRYFLERELLLEPSFDPLSVLPDLDALIVGSTVHRILQAIAVRGADTGLATLDEMIEAEPSTASWPSEAELARLVRRIAQSALTREGMHLPGLLHGLVARIQPLLSWARELAWSEGLDGVLGAEANGHAPISDVTIRFRVDQVQRREGKLELIDFKTGRPFADRKTSTSRRRQLLDAISQGRALQAAVYARAAEAPGVYLYLTDLSVNFEEARRLEVEPDDREAMSRLDRAVSILSTAEAMGIRIPRLNERPRDNRDQPRMCGHCPVSQACLQHESTARNRQRQWVDAHPAADAETTSLEQGVAALWWMTPRETQDESMDGAS